VADPRINVYHNLATLLAAGVPIVRALQAVSATGRLGRLFREIAASVAATESLTEAVEARRRHFDPLDVALIGVGENTGQLNEIFQMLADWYDFRQRLRRVINSGMMLPVLMIHALALLGPVPSLALGGWDVGGYLGGVLGILALFYIPALVIAGIVFLTPRRGLLRTLLDTFIWGVPLLGSAVRDLALSRYCTVFSIALRAGLPILRAAEMAVDAVQNAVVRRAVMGGAEAVKRGQEMSTGFGRHCLPGEFVAIWEVGEETGDLDQSAQRLGRIYGQNAERRFEALAAWTPRLVYVVVAAVMIHYIFKGFSQIYGGIGANFDL